MHGWSVHVLFANPRRQVFSRQGQYNTTPDKKAHFWTDFLFCNQSTCCEYSKEPFPWDGSLEYQQHMFWLRNKKQSISYIAISCISGVVSNIDKHVHCKLEQIVFFIYNNILSQFWICPPHKLYAYKWHLGKLKSKLKCLFNHFVCFWTIFYSSNGHDTYNRAITQIKPLLTSKRALLLCFSPAIWPTPGGRW